MSKMSRRTFLGSSAAAAGACTIGNISGCSALTPDSPVSKKARYHPLDGIERENIKITDVKVTLLSSELPQDKWWGYGTVECWKRDCAVIEVFTDQGIVGLGGTRPGNVQMQKTFIEERIKPAILGKNPFDVEYLTCGVTGGVTVAWSGVGNALWDIIGKAKNMPVYKLLTVNNEPETHLRMYASAGLSYKWYDRPEALIDEAVRLKEEGFTGFKWRGGTSWEYSNVTIKDNMKLFEKLRAAVGPDFTLLCQSTAGATLEEFIEIQCPLMEELKFYWIEEPFSHSREGGIERFIRINEALPTVNLVGGESRQDRYRLLEWINRNAYDIVQCSVNGAGITEAWHIARSAHIQGKLYTPECWHGGLSIMATAHFVAGIPNRLVGVPAMEINQTYDLLRTEIFKDPLVVVDGYIDVPDKPGFGMELAPDLEKKFPFIPGSHMRRNPEMI